MDGCTGLTAGGAPPGRAVSTRIGRPGGVAAATLVTESRLVSGGAPSAGPVGSSASSLSGASSLIEAGDQPPVAYVDSPAGNLLLHKDRDVQQLTKIYNRVRAKALDEDGTLRLITRAIEET